MSCCMWCGRDRRPSRTYDGVCRGCVDRLKKRVALRALRREIRTRRCVCGLMAFGMPLKCLRHVRQRGDLTVHALTSQDK